MTELLPCPFCGGAPVFCEDNSYGCCIISCKCEAEPSIAGRSYDLERAIAAWNARAPVAIQPMTPETEALIARLEAMHSGTPRNERLTILSVPSIAALHNAAPQLFATIREQAAEIERLRGALRSVDNYVSYKRVSSAVLDEISKIARKALGEQP